MVPPIRAPQAKLTAGGVVSAKNAALRTFVPHAGLPHPQPPMAAAPLFRMQMPKRYMAVSGGEPAIIPVPAMGDSISEGTIACWHKKAGDQVEFVF